MENRLAELWSIMNLLNPGLLGSAAQFQRALRRPRSSASATTARAQRLQRLVAPFLLRRTKAQVLTDLPPRTEIVHRVEPGAEERALPGSAAARAPCSASRSVAADAGAGQAASTCWPS